MRLEVTIPDNSAEAAILKGISDPTGFLIELVRRDGGTHAGNNHNNRNPDYMAILAQADQSPNRFQTLEEIDKHISDFRDEW